MRIQDIIIETKPVAALLNAEGTFRHGIFKALLSSSGRPLPSSENKSAGVSGAQRGY